MFKSAVSLCAVLATAAYAQTIGLSDRANPVPGNPCITFRNNGEIVLATCSLELVDRHVTPGTSASGASVLVIERAFEGRAGGESCIGLAGGKFRAEDCDATNIEFARLENDSLVSDSQCVTGVNGNAEIQIGAKNNDLSNCSKYDSLPV